MIDSYEFGKIVIKGKAYTQDLIISLTGIQSEWWRREGHKLYPEDIKKNLVGGIEALIVGTGAAGCMEILPEIYKMAEDLNFEIIALPTEQAVKKFNQLVEVKKNIVGAFHLTC